MEEIGVYAKIPSNVYKQLKIICEKDGVRIKIRIAEIIKNYIEWRKKNEG